MRQKNGALLKSNDKNIVFANKTFLTVYPLKISSETATVIIS